MVLSATTTPASVNDNFRLSQAKRIKNWDFQMNLCKFIMKAKLSVYESGLKLARLKDNNWSCPLARSTRQPVSVVILSSHDLTTGGRETAEWSEKLGQGEIDDWEVNSFTTRTLLSLPFRVLYIILESLLCALLLRAAALSPRAHYK